MAFSQTSCAYVISVDEFLLNPIAVIVSAVSLLEFDAVGCTTGKTSGLWKVML